MAKIANLQRLGQYMALTWTDKKKTLFVQTPAGLWLPQSQPGGGDGPGPEPGEGGWTHPLGPDYPRGAYTTYSGEPSHDAGALDFPTGYGGELPLYAPCDGEVVDASPDIFGGKTIVIAPDDETATGVTMVHMNRVDVTVGQHVTGGTQIGITGWSGNVRPPGPGGAHLHLEVRKTYSWGSWYPALSYFADRGVTL